MHLQSKHLGKIPVYLLVPVLLLLTTLHGGVLGSVGGPQIRGSEPGVIYQDDIPTTRPNRVAVINVTGWGIIRFELYDNMTPITTTNFVKLAESGFYDGCKFHRCIDDFVAQTGDPNSKDNNPYNDGWGGSDETIPLEIHHNATHVDGAVGMARESEPDTASSQFYICDGPQHGLDDEVRMEDRGEHGYAVFGVVIEGLDVAKAIAACETYGNKRPALKDHPVDDIVMSRVTIEEGEWPNGTGGEPGSGEKDDYENKLPTEDLGAVMSITWIILLIVGGVFAIATLIWWRLILRRR